MDVCKGESEASGGGGCTWAKPGRFGSFFVLCFLALGGHCLQMLCLPGFRTHANTQNRPHFRASPAIIQEQCPPKCLFFMANAKLPNRPGLPSYRGGSNFIENPRKGGGGSPGGGGAEGPGGCLRRIGEFGGGGG